MGDIGKTDGLDVRDETTDSVVGTKFGKVIDAYGNIFEVNGIAIFLFLPYSIYGDLIN